MASALDRVHSSVILKVVIALIALFLWLFDIFLIPFLKKFAGIFVEAGVVLSLLCVCPHTLSVIVSLVLEIVSIFFERSMLFKQRSKLIFFCGLVPSSAVKLFLLILGYDGLVVFNLGFDWLAALD